MTAPHGAWQLAVMAKEPVPGQVKTRLCPPLTHHQAAELAAAALADTLAAGLASGAGRCLVVLDGRPGPWLPAGVEVVAQRGGPFGERLAGAVADAYAGWAVPVVVIGMDTPQVTPALLDAAAAPLLDGRSATTLGPADDGGFWALGTLAPVPAMFDGVPMSTDRTGAEQRAALNRLGLSCTELAGLRDVDHVDDAAAVAAAAPRTRFAAAFAAAFANLQAVAGG